MEKNGQAQVEQGAKDGGTEAPEQMADQTRLEGKSGGEADGQAKQGQHLERVLQQHKHQQHVLVEVQQCGGRVEAQVEQRRQQQKQHCNDWGEFRFGTAGDATQSIT